MTDENPPNPGPTSSRVIAGVPAFWQTAHDYMREFFRVANDLPSVANRFLAKPVRGKLGMLIHFHAAIVADSFGALIILCLNGYCQDAVVIARSMFEYALNARYLQQAPLSEIDDYIDFHWVLQKKYYDYLVRFASDDAAKIPASTVQAMEGEIARVEARFLRKNKKGLRNSWCAKSIRERADSVGMGELYPTFYAMASGLAHGDVSVLDARSAKHSPKIVRAPSVSGMKKALEMGHMTFLTTFAVLNDVGGLSLDNDLNKAKNDFLRLWRKP